MSAPSKNPRSSLLRQSAVLGAIHFVVDAACVAAIWRCGASTVVPVLNRFGVVLGYDVLAFATQFPLGVWLDRRGLGPTSVYCGLGLSLAAIFLVPYSAVATMVAAGLGNSLFHVGAGAFVLARGNGHAAPAGVFVAPGALGLGLGMWMGKSGLGPLWPLVLGLGLAFAMAYRIHHTEPEALSTGYRLKRPPSDLARGIWLALLFLSVACRAFVGFGAPASASKGIALLLGLPLVAFGGKLLGGLLADRIGWVLSSVSALILSAPLLAWGGGSLPTLLPGLLLFQMTMPVTLVAVERLLPGRPATAFGFPCLALILGSIPTFFPWGRAWYSPGVFCLLILGSALCIALALLGMEASPEKIAPADGSLDALPT